MGKFARKVYADEKPHPQTKVALAMRNAGVQRSSDLERVLALPRRVLDLEKVDDVTEAFRAPGGTLSLRPVQSAALLEAEEAEGLVGSIGVGWGKTLILLLLPEAMKAERAVLLVPNELKKQLLERDLPFYSKHFEIPLDRIARDSDGNLGILSYSELSVPVRVGGIPKWWQWTAHVAGALGAPLERFAPDLIVADEAHRLRRRESARTRTFLAYFKEHPETKFACLSGSLAQGSIRDYWTLATLALKKNVPMPLQFTQLVDWADALDPPKTERPPTNPGALWLFCEEAELDAGTLASKAFSDPEGARSVVRDGYRRRLVETPGWVATSEQAFGGSLYFRKRRPKVPKVVLDALDKLRETWEVGGEEISEAMRLAQVARRLACGFYHKVVWPGGKVDQDYLDAKRAWKREVRERLKGRVILGMTTELNLVNAAISGRWDSQTWKAWKRVRDKWPASGPPTTAVWISDYLVKDAIAWAKDAGEGLIWFSDVPLGKAIAEAGGFPYYGEGTDAGETNPKESPIVVVSAFAQAEGKNLQAWSKNLVLRPSSNSKVWEQKMGRTHRPGQLSDEVWFDVEITSPESEEAIARAITVARNVKETQGLDQKILLANFVE